MIRLSINVDSSDDASVANGTSREGISSVGGTESVRAIIFVNLSGRCTAPVGDSVIRVDGKVTGVGEDESAGNGCTGGFKMSNYVREDGGMSLQNVCWGHC